MDETLHQLRSPGMMIPLQISTQWFSVSKWCKIWSIHSALFDLPKKTQEGTVIFFKPQILGVSFFREPQKRITQCHNDGFPFGFHFFSTKKRLTPQSRSLARGGRARVRWRCGPAARPWRSSWPRTRGASETSAWRSPGLGIRGEGQRR